MNFLANPVVRRTSCCSSVAKSCPTLRDRLDCSTSGFPVFYCLLELAQTHVHWVSDAINHLILCLLLLLLPSVFPSSKVFSNEVFRVLSKELFTSSGQCTGASASSSVLPMNIQGWFPLELTGLISLLSKGFLRVFSSISSAFFVVQLSQLYMTTEKNRSFDLWIFVGKVISLFLICCLGLS